VESSRAQGSSDGKPEDPRRRFELLQDCRELVISRLSKVIGEALTKMSDELSGLALKSRNQDEQRSLLDAVAVVRQHRTEIELRFRRSFTDVFERRLFNRRVENAESQETGELALVDDSVLQAKLALDRLVHRARGKVDPDEALGIRARLAALLDRDWFDENQHPASPEAVFEALKASLNDIAPQPDVQAALLDAFEPHVSENLNQVYSTVNHRLIASQVLPKIRPQVAQQADRRSTSAADRDQDDPTVSGDASPRFPDRGSPLPGTGQAPSGDQASAQMSRIDQEIAEVLAQVSSGSEAARASATRMLSNPEIFAVADLPLPAARAPLLDSLSSLQVSSASGPVVAPAELLADLGERVREQGSPLDQLTVEIVSMVFDYIYADKRLADVVKQQLLRLQVVAVKAALIDRSFFARRQHPMRRLIDRITDIAADPDAELAAGSPLVKGVEEVVEWVIVEFDRDLAIFDEARERIEALAADEMARRSERIVQLTREAEHAEAVAHARELARARVSDRLDPETPEFVRSFLDDWWSLALAEAQVAPDASAIGFDEGLGVAESLIWSVAPKYPEEVPRLASLLPKLINGLMRGVRLASMPDASRQAFFDALLKAHTAAIDAAKHSAAAAAARKPSNLRMRADGKIQFAPVVPPSEPARVEPAMVESRTVLLGELRRGAAIEVDETGSGEFVAFKLSWISPAQQLYVLSRFPDRAMSLGRGKLAELFDTGRARIVEASSMLDRAIESIGVASATDVQRSTDEAVTA